MLIEVDYKQVRIPINSTLYAVQNNEYRWGVVNAEGEIIVPFGKYAWIDGFQNGIAKVISYNDKSSPNIIAILDNDLSFVSACERHCITEQGIINELGEEVLPLEYNIWKFYGKDFPTIKVFKAGVREEYYYSELNPEYEDSYSKCSCHHSFGNYCDRTYGEYAGSYAQDVMGYDDDAIGDAFEGDPDVYWNID